MTLTLFCDGQSNAIGRNDDGPKTCSPLVTVWNNRSDRLDTAFVGDAWAPVDFASPPFVNGCNNAFVHLANAIASETGQEVRLIISAKGGEPIGSWYASNTRQALYLRMQAILTAAGVSQVDIWARMQGEGDDKTLTNTFLGRFEALHDCMRQDGYTRHDTPFLCVGVAAKHPDIDRTLNYISGLSPIHQYVKTSDLPTTDDVHYTGAALATIGHRMFVGLTAIEARRAAMGLAPVLVPAV